MESNSSPTRFKDLKLLKNLNYFWSKLLIVHIEGVNTNDRAHFLFALSGAEELPSTVKA